MQMYEENLIGKSIKYFDYLGSERYGSIAAIEPYPEDQNQRYIYIEDCDPEFNIHQDCITGKNINYAEIRLSSEVYIDD